VQGDPVGGAASLNPRQLIIPLVRELDERHLLFAHAVFLSASSACCRSSVTRCHMTRPRLSMYRLGHRVIATSVRSSNPPSTIRDASAIAVRVVAISVSSRSSGAQIRAASRTGASIWTPFSGPLDWGRRNGV
jgi:hypothetical protein